VLPSNARSEAFGIVLVEAMASGLPCVTTEIGSGNSWIVKDGVTGYVVPPNDHEALASCIKRLMSNPELCKKMGRAGRARAEKFFDKSQMVEKIYAVYEEALHRAR
jgi:rhamnosyl/mannosyltransferase